MNHSLFHRLWGNQGQEKRASGSTSWGSCGQALHEREWSLLQSQTIQSLPESQTLVPHLGTHCRFSLGSAHHPLCRNKFSHSGLRVANLLFDGDMTKLTGGSQALHPGTSQEHPRVSHFKYPSSVPLSLSPMELRLMMQSVLGLAGRIQKVLLG